MGLAVAQRFSYAEYLDREHSSETRHEFVSGEIVAMAGGSVEHGRLIARLTMLIGRSLEGKPCVVLSSDVRVRIRAADRATYPDLQVVCGAIERDDEDADAIVNPVLIVEVLSDSTTASDRGDKFADYRRLRSLREYVLVSQRARRVDRYRRDGKRWVLEEFERGQRVAFESIGVELEVDALYSDGLGAIIR